MLVFDEVHYVPLAGRAFCPLYYRNVWQIIHKFWNRCHIVFTSTTINKQSIHYVSMMMHPLSPWKNSSMFNRNCGLDIPDVNLPVTVPFNETFWNGLIWGTIAREGINIQLTFSINWLKSTASHIKHYTSNGCQFSVHCSSANDASERVYSELNKFFTTNSMLAM